MLRPPQSGVHQGAVYARVPIPWLRPPLYVMRPRARAYEDMTATRADRATDVFAGDEGSEVLVAQAKARPVVVLSTSTELRRLRQVRVVPLYSYRRGSALDRLQKEIRDGGIAGAFHLSGDQSCGIRDGALRLDQMQAVDSDFLNHQVASLTDGALGALLDQIARYVRLLDRRAAS
jgi:mRNA-degrading endonuclease toxin of MazEF toxin-antitoxin module